MEEVNAKQASPSVFPFSSHAEFESQLLACISRARRSLKLFDPDFEVFPFNSIAFDAALRQFLLDGGILELVTHRPAYIEKHYPRFLHLLRDHGHRLHPRATNKSLHHLTDSFCIADGVHIVRRFHSDHMRGEAAFDAPAATEVSLDRFAGMWEESISTLHPTTTGL